MNCPEVKCRNLQVSVKVDPLATPITLGTKIRLLSMGVSLCDALVWVGWVTRLIIEALIAECDKMVRIDRFNEG